jgi:hypothetical protein
MEAMLGVSLNELQWLAKLDIALKLRQSTTAPVASARSIANAT